MRCAAPAARTRAGPEAFSEWKKHRVSVPFAATDTGRGDERRGSALSVACALSMIDAGKKRSTEVDGRHGFDSSHF
jgi:hypothetical protein